MTDAGAHSSIESAQVGAESDQMLIPGGGAPVVLHLRKKPRIFGILFVWRRELLPEGADSGSQEFIGTSFLTPGPFHVTHGTLC